MATFVQTFTKRFVFLLQICRKRGWVFVATFPTRLQTLGNIFANVLFFFNLFKTFSRVHSQEYGDFEITENLGTLSQEYGNFEKGKSLGAAQGWRGPSQAYQDFEKDKSLGALSQA